MVIPNAKLMSYGHGGKGRREEEEDAAGKKEAVKALMHRFKAGVEANFSSVLFIYYYCISWEESYRV